MAPLIAEIEIRRKAFGGRTVLGPLQLRLAAGEIVALAGPSGCGKTTLLRIIAGLDQAYEGIVRFPAGPARIGMAFQEPRLLPWLSVMQNLTLVRPPSPDALEPVLRALGVWELRGAYPGALSGGQARRIALARALAVEPSLLLLDEAFASLDPAAAASSRDVMLEFWRRRRPAVLLVTHDIAEAAALADRVLRFEGGPGRIAAEWTIPPASRRAGLDAGALVAAGFAATSASPDRR